MEAALQGIGDLGVQWFRAVEVQAVQAHLCCACMRLHAWAILEVGLLIRCPSSSTQYCRRYSTP